MNKTDREQALESWVGILNYAKAQHEQKEYEGSVLIPLYGEDIKWLEVITTALSQPVAQDVEGCEPIVKECQRFIEGKYKQNKCDIPPVNNPDIRLMVNYLNEQGYLTTPDTITIPLKELEGMRKPLKDAPAGGNPWAIEPAQHKRKGHNDLIDTLIKEHGR